MGKDNRRKNFDKHPVRTAILVDGGFYRKRAKALWGNKSPSERANELNDYCYVDDITTNDLELNLEQKGVDMCIGVDISSLVFKKQVNQIILVSGDSDFVPAAKQARREGIDFILDPMRSTIKDDLFEHIDGIRTPSMNAAYLHKEV